MEQQEAIRAKEKVVLVHMFLALFHWNEKQLSIYLLVLKVIHSLPQKLIMEVEEVHSIIPLKVHQQVEADQQILD